jgi:CheY-like chemotaxis protein
MHDEPAVLLSRDEFLQVLADSGLFGPDELAAPELCSSSLPDADAVARHFESTGRLTSFQTRALRERKFSELLIGNYEILDRLGVGGMGTVFKARHRRMKRVVALKVMSRALCRDQKSVQRFQREVEAIARLSHPNIVLAHDADEAEIGHFLVMEYVSGTDLASLVQRSGPFTVREAVSCIRQAARGLEYAHAQGIIHRDIKPANLLRDAQGVVKITDLGLARLNDPAGGPVANSGLTQAGGVVGTVDYMSPEQAFDSTRIDPRADIYSLGCTLHYLLTGAPPYTGTSIMATLLKHRESPVPALTAVRPDVPAALDAAFHQMMAKNPAHRFPSMSALLTALDQVPLPDVEPARPGAPPSAGSGALTGQWRSTSVEGPGGAAATDQTVAIVPGASALPRTAPAPAEAPPRVLVVEPSRTQAGIVRRYLQALGIEPLPNVTTGGAAVDAIRTHRPEVVVSALHLDDMTGAQLAERLCAEGADRAPAFLLISSEGAVVGSLSRAGNAQVLTKPFSLEQLAEALSALTHRALVPGSPTQEFSRIVPAGHQGEPKVDRARLKVLLVDDSATARAHVRGVLQGLGLSRIVEAENGATAVARAVTDPVDLIVTDYNMPLMDGHGLLGFLRQNPATAAVPVIMVTTETDPRKLDAVRQLGGVDVCDKCFGPEVVGPILERLFGS